MELIFLTMSRGVGRDDIMYTIWDTDRVFMIVILPRRVSLLADQLSKIPFIFSIRIVTYQLVKVIRSLTNRCLMFKYYQN